MVKPPAAHTPTSGRGRLVNVTNESTFSETIRSTRKTVMGRGTNRVRRRETGTWALV